MAKIIIMYSIGNTPIQGKDLTAYRLDLPYPTALYHIILLNTIIHLFNSERLLDKAA